MNLIGLLIFGLIFSFVLFGYLKPEFIFPNSTYIYLNYRRLKTTKRTVYFVFILVIGTVFLLLSAFQYINTAEYARWTNGGCSNDMSRYWFGFRDAERYTLRKFLLSQGQEPLYILLVWCMRKITSYFSFVLFAAYAFVFLSIIKFLKEFVKTVNCVLVISFFCIFYTFVLISYCLFRMGLAVAISLYTYRYLLRNKWKMAIFTSLIACGFHFSAAILFPVCLMYLIYSKKTLRLKFFLEIFFSVVCVGVIFAKIVPSILEIIGNRYLTYKSQGIATNTYITSFLFLLMILYKRKLFLKSKIDDVCFISLLSTFIILDLQMVMTIFYRMIFFTYPCMMLLIQRLFHIYKIKKMKCLCLFL